MKKIFAANWKLHKNPFETRDFFSDFKSQIKTLSKNENREIVFFPSSSCLEALSQSVAGSEIKWGAQNCHSEIQGAFTGETSAQVVKDLGGHYILLGHSERRTLFAEKDEGIAKKLTLVQKLDLIPLLCIGETLPEREAGKTNQVLESQLQKDLAGADPTKALVIAYEPVWAIGTGKVATVDQVREAHLEISQILGRLGFSPSTSILYGGSVKVGPLAKEFLALPHVAGFLVGGASLEATSFKQICESE